MKKRSFRAGMALCLLLLALVMPGCIETTELRDRQATQETCARTCHEADAMNEDLQTIRMYYWEFDKDGEPYLIPLSLWDK